MAQESSGLPELLDALRWRWKLTALITLGVFAGAAFYVQGLPSEYEGKALVVVAPRANVDAAGADSVRLLAPTYISYITAGATIARVAPRINEDPSELGDAVDASLATDTGNISVTVRLEDAERAANVANAFAQEAVSFSQTDPLLRAQIVAMALSNDSPVAPPRKLLQAAALVVGLLLGVAISFLFERGRPRLRSWRDITKMTGYPVLGRIPRARILRQRPTEAFSDPSIGAAFRTLRTNLEREWRDRTLHVIMVTSPNASDGKTTVTALFAESLARLGSKVLLVDSDLRRPGVAKTFGLDASSGLVQVLKSEMPLEEAVQRGWAEGLSVLATTSDEDAGDLIARRFAEVIDDARQNYEVIIVDTPPLLGTDDARTIATLTDGVLVVVSAGTHASSVNEAVLALEGLRAPVLGAVGNRLREAKRAYQYT